METKIQINQKLIKRKILELAKTKKELHIEKNKNTTEIAELIRPKQDNDILTVKMIAKQYKLSEKTVYRYINRGMKASQGTTKGYHFAVRKDVEDFLKRDQYDVYK